jgi:hypothetical protein
MVYIRLKFCNKAGSVSQMALLKTGIAKALPLTDSGFINHTETNNGQEQN